jgi:hypothetical protein
MGANKLGRRITAWIAGFSILMASLAPSISHALAVSSDTGSSWAEICSTAGFKLIRTVNDQADHASDSPVQKQITHVQHCPFCASHAGAVALMPSAGITIPVLDAAHLFPSLFYRSPRALFIWAAARPRGPPIFL